VEVGGPSSRSYGPLPWRCCCIGPSASTRPCATTPGRQGRRRGVGDGGGRAVRSSAGGEQCTAGRGRAARRLLDRPAAVARQDDAVDVDAVVGEQERDRGGDLLSGGDRGDLCLEGLQPRRTCLGDVRREGDS